MHTDTLAHLHAQGLLRDIDLQFARFIAAMCPPDCREDAGLAAALLSAGVTATRNICLDLRAAAGMPVSAVLPAGDRQDALERARVRTPPHSRWKAALRSCPAVGAPGDVAPLILDEAGERLYLYRHWHCEQELARIAARLLRQPAPAPDPPLNLPELHACFPGDTDGPDWQQVAAFAALRSRFCVITGGPGTGKTRTVAGLLALLLSRFSDVHIRLCAPTGKAAARLQESVRQAVSSIACPPEVRALIPDSAVTIHRLLGTRLRGNTWRHGPDNPLIADVVVVDEASMVPLELLARLAAALPAHARLILLGDKEQLASVEAGAAFGDICAAADIGCFSENFRAAWHRAGGPPLPGPAPAGRSAALNDCIVQLSRSYRFADASGIGALARAVISGNARAARAVLDSEDAHTRYRPLPKTGEPDRDLLAALCARIAVPAGAATVAAAIEALERFRVLCAMRSGHWGTEALNRAIQDLLHEQGVIDTCQPFYRGRPLMITRNDYTMQLFNGDTGLIWPDSAGELRAWFSDRDGTLRSLAPARLPAHETVYAMTVHKSQGSEFDEVVLVLPERDSPLLTRELVYTGITRARTRVELWAGEAVLTPALQRRVQRTSGLQDALRREIASDGQTAPVTLQ